MTNSRRVIGAAERVFERLSKMSEKEFRRYLEEHADADIANALIDLHYFEVGELEADAFQFQIDEIPSVAQDWHGITFDYHPVVFNDATFEVAIAIQGINYLTESTVISYSKSDIVRCSSQEYHIESKETEPWPLAA